MKSLERIVIATDFSQASEDAKEMALRLARTFNSEILLIHVIHVIPEFKDYPVAKSKIKKAVTEKLRQMEADLNRQGISSVETVVKFGIPFEWIIEHSDEMDANVIVLGSGEKVKGERFHLGTTAERVVRHAKKPVWVVKSGSPPRIKKIVCPVAFSKTSRRALTNAVHLARTFQAHLTVMTVFEPLLSDYFGVGRTPGETKEKIWKRRQQDQFDRFLRGFNFEGLGWAKMLRRGKAHEEILAVVHETKSNLLVMGSEGRTGLSRMLVGSTTERVVREMPCSMITLKQEHLLQLHLDTEVADIETHFKRGLELLEKGSSERASDQFEYCILKDVMFAPAWEGLAEAHKRLGHKEAFRRCKAIAEYIRQSLWRNDLKVKGK